MEKELITNLDFFDFLTKSSEIELQNKRIVNININSPSTPIFDSKKIINCDFENGGLIKSIDLRDTLTFEDCIFSGNDTESFKIENVSRGKLVFLTSNKFYCKVEFVGLKCFSAELGGQFFKELIINGGETNLSIRGSGGKRSSYSDITLVRSSNFKSILFRDLKQEGNIIFHQSVSGKLNFAQGEYDTIKFHNVRNAQSIKFGSVASNNISFKANNINFPNCTTTDKIEFINAEIKNLNMQYLNIREGVIVFRTVKFNGDVQFENSDLENVKFIDTDFHDAKLFFDKSIIDKVIFSNITWTSNHSVESKLPVGTKEDRIRRYKILTEVYRQLKKNSLSESDNIRALKFYRNEMDAYWNRIRLDKTETPWNRFLIVLNKFSSNFGQSYMQPLILLFVFHFILFSCILNWNYYGNDLSGSEEFGQFWVLLNPVHKTPDYINSGAGHFTEFVMRVFGGYFIYHFIRATRKFGKV